MRTAPPLFLSLLHSGNSLWFRTALRQCPRSLYSLHAQTPGRRSSGGRVRGVENLALATVVINIACCEMVVLLWECCLRGRGGRGVGCGCIGGDGLKAGHESARVVMAAGLG